jgi:hypothetical protein
MVNIWGFHGDEYKISIFWDVAQYSLVDVDRHFRGAYCLHHQGDELHHPDDGGIKILWNKHYTR